MTKYLAVAALMLTTTVATAATESWTGKIYAVRITSEDAHTDPNYINENAIVVSGKAALGTCATVNYGGTVGTVIYLRVRDNVRGQAFLSTAIAARAAGWNVEVSADDTKKDALGYCYVRYLGVRDGV